MHKILTISLLLIGLSKVEGQVPCEGNKTISINPHGDSIIAIVEEMPYTIGGLESYYKWIKKNIDRKLISKKKEKKKIAYIGFTVNEDGTRTDFEVAKVIGEPYDSEALRLTRDNPIEWVAGKCGKKKVKTRIVMPVTF